MSAAPDIAIGDTFARPDALGEAWEVTDLSAMVPLYTLMRGESMKFATAEMLRDARFWVRVRAL